MSINNQTNNYITPLVVFVRKVTHVWVTPRLQAECDPYLNISFCTAGFDSHSKFILCGNRPHLIRTMQKTRE